MDVGLQELRARDALYRSIPENLTTYINEQEKRAGNPDFDYASLSDDDVESGREETVQEKGLLHSALRTFLGTSASAPEMT